MKPHRFEQAGAAFEVFFERAPEGWVARIRREEDAVVHVVAFPDGPGYAAEDVRGSLIAGCEAAVANLPWPGPTRH
ncbi:hypothetical protein G3T14_15875 [Methylobacterium sp. BTF04]|uniref:hypothetical protein n=1 Tax=Methylobacterium sp. BTF04 TaxID=2708300 RepID=UPI0013CFB022|nr:hypothetical protein [Methylobacterium sp. BTF04]NEU13598.1 hypothetical protein [Methylobacterium sp. BTF04]